MIRSALLALVFIFQLVALSSCRRDIDEFINPEKSRIQDLKVPVDFKFNTEKSVTLSLKDNSEKGEAKYYIYAIDGLEETLIATKLANGGVVDVNLVLPDYTDLLRVIKKDANGESEEYIVIEGPNAQGNLSNSGGGSGCNEHVYAVTGQGGFYKIDVEGGNYTEDVLPNLTGGGSVACAVNKDSGVVYYNTGTTLRYYDYNAETFHVLSTGNPFNGSYPRMEYDHTNGLLYIGNNTKMYALEPYTNEIIQDYDVIGLESPTGGGDLAISKDGTIFLACFSGLYRLELSNDTAYATRISAENLPFSPTSMAIDRNDRLYLSTTETNARLIEMDKVDGSWNTVTTYNHKVNDLGSYKCDISQLANEDSDGDGIINQLDEFPDDPEAASATYTPSELGWGTLAYEDLWPSKGDYDFNDLVVKYRFMLIENADNEVVRVVAKFQVKAIGASYHNGFGFKMGLDPSYISEVTGYNITDNVVTLNSKGLESGHNDGSIIIVFDDAFDNLGVKTAGFVNTEASQTEIVAPEIEITIELEDPISASLIGSAPFNPFVFINGERGRELHLADYEPTDLADLDLFNTIHDDSDVPNDVYYRTYNNLPWAINIMHEFRQPVEKSPINQGYNHFNSWSVSGGKQYKDWYKDNAGYRNVNKLFIK